MLAISVRDSRTMIRLGQDESGKIEDADATARRLHLPIGTVPGHTTLVTALLSDLENFRAYSMLSAASHGEPWAITAFGFQVDEEREVGLYLAAKRPSAFWLWTALVLATIALTKASATARTYRGW